MLLQPLRGAALPVARELILDPSDRLQSCLSLLVIGAVGVSSRPKGARSGAIKAAKPPAPANPQPRAKLALAPANGP